MTLLESDYRQAGMPEIEYAGKAFLYVPASQVEMVQKYAGPSEHRASAQHARDEGLDRPQAKRGRSGASPGVEMLQLQAVREATKGIAHPAEQRVAARVRGGLSVRGNGRSTSRRRRDQAGLLRPAGGRLDRLICGDVGYGKTEIAMRAAFKAVMGGAQVAVLVPTTVLAAQHTQTFSERMADYPIRIEMLSRFRRPPNRSASSATWPKAWWTS